MDNFLLLPRVLVAAIFDAAFASAMGLILVSFWLEKGEEKLLRLKLRSEIIFCSVTLLIALPIQAYLLTATMVASSSFATVRSQWMPVLTSTHAGRALLYSGAFALLFFLLLIATPSSKRAKASPWPLVALIGLIATRALSGHAAAEGDLSLSELVQWIHLLSIAIWAGAILAAGFRILPSLLHTQQTQSMTSFTRKLSRTVTFAIILILLSGLYNSYRGLGGHLAPIVSTQWGYLLDVKLFLVGVALIMGFFSRQMLQRNNSLSQQQALILTRAVRAEAVVMLLILVVSAWLANSPPANSL